MAFFQFTKEQVIKAQLDEVWEFISSPANLKKITPPAMAFEITSPNLPEKMYQGMIISYKVKPIAGIKTSWISEITHLKEKEFFVDEQRVGPYKMWHHQHILNQHTEGVLMKDIISYQPPFGFLGRIFNSLLIKKKLKNIFDYRQQAIEKTFKNYTS